MKLISTYFGGKSKKSKKNTIKKCYYLDAEGHFFTGDELLFRNFNKMGNRVLNLCDCDDDSNTENITKSLIINTYKNENHNGDLQKYGAMGNRKLGI